MPTRTLTKKEAEQAKENRRKLLEVEAAGLILLVRARNSAVEAGLRSRLSNRLIAQQVERDLGFAIRESRRLSALAGISRLRAEAAGLGFELASAANAVEVMAAREARRAATAAKSYARRFFRAAEQSDVQKALDATKGSLRRTAVTESSDAFNAGRKQAVKQVGRSLARVWDALLDACPICAAEDGKIVGVNENFSIGEPGSVHPFCRCNWTLVTLEETR